MKESEYAVAVNLRKIRENRKMSLDRLSDCTGVSKSMLSQIEKGRSSPTIDTLWKIANGLHTSFSSLLGESESEGGVTSFTANNPLYAGSEHFRVFPLVPYDPRRAFEVYFFQMDSGSSFTSEPHGGSVVEYILVVAGTLGVAAGKNRYEAGEGMLLEFRADCTHTYEAEEGDEVTGFFILSYSE